MSDLWDLLIVPCLLVGGLLLVFGLLAFAELWKTNEMFEKEEEK